MMAREGERYVPRRVLVTGGAGFIASHVVDRLLERRETHEVTILDAFERSANERNVTDDGRCSVVAGDVRDGALVREILRVKAIDTVLHFAAETHVDASFGNSLAFTETNVIGTHVALEAARRCGTIERFVHVSTDEVYGETLVDGGSEGTSVLAPTNPYSASKAAAEMLVVAYGTSYNLPYVITRGNNVYGPRQYPEKVIPKFIHLLRRGARVPIHGDGLGLRGYMHVRDAAAAFDVVLRAGENKSIYNIGAREERTVVSVARDLCAIFNRNPEEFLEYVEDRAFNDRRYFVDSSKLEELGWRQEIEWDVGLRETVDWYHRAIDERYWGDVEPALQAHPTHPPTHSPPTRRSLAAADAAAAAADAAAV